MIDIINHDIIMRTIIIIIIIHASARIEISKIALAYGLSWIV